MLVADRCGLLNYPVHALQVDRLLAIADFGAPDKKEDSVQDDVRYMRT